VDGELWSACHVDSPKVEQTRRTPHVEFCLTDSRYRRLRVSGRRCVSTSLADKQRYLELVPELRDYFSGADDPNFIVLRTEVESMRVVDSELSTLANVGAG
jgi:general stress protein 26